jgi:hypothetical protein
LENGRDVDLNREFIVLKSEDKSPFTPTLFKVGTPTANYVFVDELPKDQSVVESLVAVFTKKKEDKEIGE